jgi:hypothetical protein
MLFPFIIWFSGYGRQTKNGARALFLWISALTVATIGGFIYLYQTNQPAAYFLMPTRFWELAVGCLVFIGFQKRTQTKQALERVPPLLVIAVMVGVMFLPINTAVPATIAIVVLSAILIICLKSGTAMFAIFTDKKVVEIGLISYSLYLWHWGLLSLCRLSIGINLWSTPLLIALIYFMAWLSYHLIELPLRQKQWFLLRWKTIFAGISTLAAAALINTALGRITTKSLNFSLKNMVPPKYVKYVGIEKKYGTNVCNIFSDTERSITLDKSCGIHSGNKASTIWNIGDSHAERFAPYVNMFAINNNVNSISIWGNSCLFPQAVRSSYIHSAKNGKSCYVISGEIEEALIKNIKKGDTVLISVFSITNKFVYLHRFESSEVKGGLDKFHDSMSNEISTDEARNLYFERLSDFAKSVADRGARVILYLNATRFDKSGYGQMCIRTNRQNTQWFAARLLRSSPNGRCLSSVVDFKNDARYKLSTNIKLLRYKIPGIIFADGLDGAACNNQFCDGSFYSDPHHIEYWYASDFISKFLK